MRDLPKSYLPAARSAASDEPTPLTGLLILSMAVAAAAALIVLTAGGGWFAAFFIYSFGGALTLVALVALRASGDIGARPARQRAFAHTDRRRLSHG